jgi:hypothetical protein
MADSSPQCDQDVNDRPLSSWGKIETSRSLFGDIFFTVGVILSGVSGLGQVKGNPDGYLSQKQSLADRAPDNRLGGGPFRALHDLG